MRKLIFMSFLFLSFSSFADICENSVNVDNCLLDTLNRIEKALGYKRPNLFDPCVKTTDPHFCEFQENVDACFENELSKFDFSK